MMHKMNAIESFCPTFHPQIRKIICLIALNGFFYYDYGDIIIVKWLCSVCVYYVVYVYVLQTIQMST